MSNNQQSNAGLILLILIGVAWFWWKSQQPNTDEMMLYYHNHILSGAFSKKNAEKLVSIASTYPHPEETFDLVIDYFAKYGYGDEIMAELNSANKEHTSDAAVLCVSEGNIELSNFFKDLENSSKFAKSDKKEIESQSNAPNNKKSEPGSIPVSDRATQARSFLKKASDAIEGKDYSQAAEYYDKLHDLMPDENADVRDKISTLSDSLRQLATSQTETDAQTTLAAVKDLGPALTEVFKQWHARSPEGLDAQPTTPPPPPSSLNTAKQVWIDAGTTLYFLDKPYIVTNQVQQFDVLKYDSEARRVYVLSHDAKGKPIALNVSEEKVGR